MDRAPSETGRRKASLSPPEPVTTERSTLFLSWNDGGDWQAVIAEMLRHPVAEAAF
jgi:hypothetical protein